MEKYHQKGIFRVTQLSDVFSPNRRRRKSRKSASRFNIELQALALRTRKIYVHELPSIPQHHTELFLDIEGVPDCAMSYLVRPGRFHLRALRSVLLVGGFTGRGEEDFQYLDEHLGAYLRRQKARLGAPISRHRHRTQAGSSGLYDAEARDGLCLVPVRNITKNGIEVGLYKT